uniref:Uncharacterized protein n=1 Tax=Oryzias sinensis TaxID=183150 RepID=A0A8C7WU11_9TELE
MFVSIFLLWLCFFFVLFQSKLWRPKNFPPGPLSLPVLGNLLHLNLKNPLVDFEKVNGKLSSPCMEGSIPNPAPLNCMLAARKEAED